LKISQLGKIAPLSGCQFYRYATQRGYNQGRNTEQYSHLV